MRNFWHFSQQLYPDLPPIDAYLALHRDYVAPIVGPVLHGTLTTTEALALWTGSTPWVAKIQALRQGKEVAERLFSYTKSLCATQQSTLSSLTADEKQISAHLTTEILRRYTADTLGQPTPFTDGVDTAAGGASLAGGSAKNIPQGITNNLSLAASASSGPAESLFDRINYFECFNTALRMIQTAQAQRMIKALDVIAEKLEDGNCITVMGASGPDGFARPVYDLIRMKINKINAADRENHRFFIYHNSNTWHQAFERLTGENPLPPEFINNPCDDLDHACLFMREVRQTLLAKDEKRGKGMIFHLLIPSWSKLQIKEPLHFPEDLYPLQIKGLKHNGKGTGVAVTAPAVGWEVNGACLALGLGVGTLTGAGLLLALLLWMGTAPFAMGKSAPVIQETIYDALREEDPRVLGSNERLRMPGRRS
ncbi:hypothetical protein KXX13_001175 [Aspergillus fumigatus]|nr:hypothetical protein KXX13_001175 [Aspergillus fumigatus]KAH1915220.1 hypothetical protein KXW69_006072 [Aspergillus fumigatus]KAH2532181.1 hypothetical protein KXW12_003670 [Aspergillus fumigatus]KAH3212882.1 hypothetical protein KXV86_003629 [Aspergillus fumigatus]KAH3244975.1 hypothetical protein KXW23_003396 [Aspergillus fumigatus]